MKLHPRLILLLFCVCLLPPAMAFRCDGKIISENAHNGEVRTLCGDPLNVRQYTDYKIVAIQRPHRHHRSAQFEFITVPVNIEEWTYDMGPNDLMRRLRFENGELTRITTLGYGL